MERLPAIAVVIVTHDSARVLPSCLAALAEQSVPPAEVLVVDSGSGDPSYLDAPPPLRTVRVVRLAENVGFSQANNIGFRQCGTETDYLLFLNPDALLAPDALAQAVRLLEADRRVGILGGLLRGYDFSLRQPTGLIDSAGICRKWYGRWVDRGQGDLDHGQYCRAQDVPAVCGAMLFCRRSALEQVLLPGPAVFDPDFFLYKEDIELCLRVRRRGWLVRFAPGVAAWHGRGWKQRGEMSLALRTAAARSEIILYRKHPSPYLLWALMKYLAVRILKV
mgnify:CR=1 FL=1